MPPASPTLHTRITDDVAELLTLLPRLEEEIPEKRRNPHGGFGSGQGGHHPLAAWNTAAAMLVADIHYGARELECDLRYRISGRARSRGASSVNTTRSLQMITSLISGVTYHDGRIAAIRIESWIHRGRLILGDEDPLSRLPRQPGQADPCCPFCGSKGTLRARLATGMIACVRPSCRDSEGNRTRGVIEVGAFSAETSIVWADGTTGLRAS
jgi:hypothetical protein